MIEPLSIYSNNSPPVEINDESIGGDNDGTGPSHHGILHMPSINERRISEGGLSSEQNHPNSQLAASTHTEGEEEDEDDDISNSSPRVRFNLGPSSTARSDSDRRYSSHSAIRRAISQRLVETSSVNNDVVNTNHSAGGIHERNG